MQINYIKFALYQCANGLYKLLLYFSCERDQADNLFPQLNKFKVLKKKKNEM